METIENKDKKIEEALKTLSEKGISPEAIQAYFIRQKNKNRVELFNIPKRFSDNYDTREDWEGK